mmetsp:Transcript_29986/g.95734  ORF Transcript_29986/g.95734 Transcript_29986/m.95734 type:complete len:200 (+) Transcript_29986:481-1080(+)
MALRDDTTVVPAPASFGARLCARKGADLHRREGRWMPPWASKCKKVFFTRSKAMSDWPGSSVAWRLKPVSSSTEGARSVPSCEDCAAKPGTSHGEVAEATWPPWAPRSCGAGSCGRSLVKCCARRSGSMSFSPTRRSSASLCAKLHALSWHSPPLSSMGQSLVQKRSGSGCISSGLCAKSHPPRFRHLPLMWNLHSLVL